MRIPCRGLETQSRALLNHGTYTACHHTYPEYSSIYQVYITFEKIPLTLPACRENSVAVCDQESPLPGNAINIIYINIFAHSDVLTPGAISEGVSIAPACFY